MKKPFTVNRRNFVKYTTGALAGIPILVATNSSAQDLPIVTEDDPTAIALGYKADATTVDTATYAIYKEGQLCSNCTLYTGDATAESGPCGVFPGKSVKTAGWCSAWTPKA